MPNKKCVEPNVNANSNLNKKNKCQIKSSCQQQQQQQQQPLQKYVNKRLPQIPNRMSTPVMQDSNISRISGNGGCTVGPEDTFKTTPTSSAHQQIMSKPIKMKPQIPIDRLNETKPSSNQNTTHMKKEYQDISSRPICREKEIQVKIVLSITNNLLIMIG